MHSQRSEYWKCASLIVTPRKEHPRGDRSIAGNMRARGRKSIKSWQFSLIQVSWYSTRFCNLPSQSVTSSTNPTRHTNTSSLNSVGPEILHIAHFIWTKVWLVPAQRSPPSSLVLFQTKSIHDAIPITRPRSARGCRPSRTCTRSGSRSRALPLGSPPNILYHLRCGAACLLQLDCLFRYFLLETESWTAG